MSESLPVDPTLSSASTPNQPFKPGGLILSGILMLVLTLVIAFLEQNGIIPFLVSIGCTGLVGAIAVPILRQLKAGQIIRKEGPQSHLSKAGTPTMGGIYFLSVGLAVALIWTQADSTVIAATVLTLAYGLVGWLDDWQVIRQQSNKGLTPKQKFGLQLVVALGFCGWLAWIGVNWGVTLPVIGLIPLSFAFWPLVLFVLVGTNNAVNLTDGMDGLAAGVVSIVFVGLSLIVAPEHATLAVFSLCLSGSCLGFLVHNRHPAQVFMGDTGSLGLGGALAAVALLGNSLWALALLGAVLVVESLSVIAQVSYFKYTKRKTGEGKRLLKMSPLHHHLELSGWPEIQVVSVFYLVGGILAIIGWILNQW